MESNYDPKLELEEFKKNCKYPREVIVDRIIVLKFTINMEKRMALQLEKNQHLLPEKAIFYEKIKNINFDLLSSKQIFSYNKFSEIFKKYPIHVRNLILE